MTAAAVFRDLPARWFPFTIEICDEQTGRLLWRARVTGPGAVCIPSRELINGCRPVTARIRFADGHVEEAGP